RGKRRLGGVEELASWRVGEFFLVTLVATLHLSNAPTFQRRFLLEGCPKGQPRLPAPIEPAPRQVDADRAQRRVNGDADAISCLGSTVQWGGSTVGEEQIGRASCRERGWNSVGWYEGMGF